MVDQVSAQHLNPQAQQASKKLEIGWMGLLFGDASEKPGNIAGLAVLLAFVMLVIVLWVAPDSPTTPKREAVTLLGGIITGALGFLFAVGIFPQLHVRAIGASFEIDGLLARRIVADQLRAILFLAQQLLNHLLR